MKKIAVFAATAAILLSFGCWSSNVVELTKEDEGYLIKNARQILLDSKKLSLTNKEKLFIKRTTPNVIFRYTGNKKGRSFISWQVDPRKRIVAIADGELTSNARRWSVSVYKDKEDVYVTPEAMKLLSPKARKKFRLKDPE